MKKTAVLLILPLLLPLSGAASQPQPLEEGWTLAGYGPNYVNYTNGNLVKLVIGKANVYDFRSGEWVPFLLYQDGNSYVLRTGRCAVRIFPEYSVYYDPNLTEAIVSRAEWVLEYTNSTLEKGILLGEKKWRELTWEKTSITTGSNETCAWVKLTKEAKEGTMEIWFYGCWGCGIKHTVKFTSSISSSFRLVWRKMGVPAYEVKGEDEGRAIKKRILAREEFNATYLCLVGKRVIKEDLEKAREKLKRVEARPIEKGLDLIFEFGVWKLREKESFLLDPTTETFSPTDDAYVDEAAPDNNFGTSTYLMLYDVSGGTRRTYIRFDLSSIPSDAQINSAMLYLYYYDYYQGDPSGKTVVARRASPSWAEETITWNNQPTGYVPSASTTMPSSYGWVSWDVTEAVQGFVNGTWNNYGWQIKFQTEGLDTGYADPKFYSKEAATNKPYLEVTYTSGSPPNKPTLASPSPNGTTINIINPWLNVTVTDPDGDAMNLSFYWSNGTLIGTLNNVANGSTTGLQVNVGWNQDYYWYVNVTDGQDTNQSDIFHFKTRPPGCVLWLPLDEGSGTVAVDRSGKGNNGTIYGASWVYVNRSLGYALSFDGEDDYVEIDAFPYCSLFSVETWFKVREVSDTRYQRVIWFGDANAYNTIWNIYVTRFSPYYTRFEAFRSDGSNFAVNFGVANPSPYTYYVATYDGTKYRLYVNGVLKNSRTDSAPRSLTPTTLRIANRVPSADFSWIDVSVVRIYSRVLNEVEQNQSYNLLATPLNNNSITLKWQEWTYAEKYYYLVYQDNFSTLYSSGSVATNETTISFESGHRYYIKIIAEDTSLATNTTWYVCSFYANVQPTISFVQVNNPFANPGDTIVALFSSADTETATENLTVYVNISQGGTVFVSNGQATYNPSTGLFEYAFTVGETWPAGYYDITSRAVDEYGGSGTDTKNQAFQVGSGGAAGPSGPSGAASIVETTTPSPSYEEETQQEIPPIVLAFLAWVRQPPIALAIIIAIFTILYKVTSE